ncbi:MAG: glycine cleavage system protein T [Bacteroidetes bacterium HGW-Bacteroidetes-21]|jgi:aminomethyltransferase|nr:MAG: glycine cleavage system protein T [Bacteroidetes bacterium HGW-Bacteroidetes-21]
MKKTALAHIHEQMGGKMVEFAGFYMPLKFTGDIDEHVTVREKLGVFDVSHMGEIWVKGPKAFDFIQRVTSNDVAALFDGKIQYSCFPNGKGGIVDDLLVYRINTETYLLVVNASNIEKDWNWLVSQNKENAVLYNASDEISQLAVQGPLALKAMQKLTSTTVEDMEYYTFKKLEFAGVKDVIFSTTGYTGAGGCEIYFANQDAEHICKAVFEAGKEFGIKPIGLAARDTLRLEMGFCLYGNDIDDTTSPLEAGLGWITKFSDSKDFIDKDFMLKLKAEGLKKKLVGFEMIDRGIPRHYYKLQDAQGNEIGHVTSGTMSPMMKVGIGMGYVKSEFSKPDTEIYVSIRDQAVKAKVVKLPIYKK